MSYIPRLYSPRLCLRPLRSADAERVRELAGDRRVAETTALIPHPYPEGAAEKWIEAHGPRAAEGREFVFAITLTGTRTPGREKEIDETGFLVGSICLRIHNEPEQRRGLLGYWIGVPFWNKGFATEAARAVLEFGFQRRHLHRIEAQHLLSNPASGRVLEKVGLKREGVLRAHFFRCGAFHDVATFGILETEWTRAGKARRLIDQMAVAG